MKHFYYLIGILLSFSSCASTFYFSTLDSSTQNTMKGDNGDFITANDSVLVAYCFNGKNAPILIMVHNNGDKPLYIDWQRSSLIIDGKATSYKGEAVHLSGTTQNFSQEDIFFPRDTYGNGSFQGSASIPEGISFIPPRSKIEYTSYRLEGFDFERFDDKEYSKAVYTTKNNIVERVKTLKFTENNTPFKFRSYLTMYTNPNEPFTFEHEFFISSLIKSKGLTPSNISEDVANRGDVFYVEKESASKDVGAILLGTALIVGAVALDASTQNNCCD